MADKQYFSVVLTVDLSCGKCHDKINKLLSKYKDRWNIRSVVWDEKRNEVTLTGPFCPRKLSKKLCNKACKVIKSYHIPDQLCECDDEKKLIKDKPDIEDNGKPVVRPPATVPEAARKPPPRTKPLPPPSTTPPPPSTTPPPPPLLYPHPPVWPVCFCGPWCQCKAGGGYAPWGCNCGCGHGGGGGNGCGCGHGGGGGGGHGCGSHAGCKVEFFCEEDSSCRPM